MRDATDMTPDEILSELAAMGLELARDLYAGARAAEPEAKADLTLAFHRISRSVRQTLALKARFERDRKLALREADQAHARETLGRVLKKRSQVRKAVARDVWTEHEGEDAEALIEDLESWVYEASGEDDFLDTPLEAVVARIRQAMGLSANTEAPPGEPLDVVIWKSG